jgi:hypothetical protein
VTAGPGDIGPADEYVRAVEERFRQHRARPLLLSPADFRRVLSWHGEAIPLWLVLRTLDELFARARVQDREGPKSLRYCEPRIRRALKEWREAQAGAAEAPRPAAVDPDLRGLLERAAGQVEASAAPPAVREATAARLRELGAAPAVPAGSDLLAELDRELVGSALAALPAAEREEMTAAASAEVERFGGAMSRAIRERALRKAVTKRVRQRCRLPDLTLLPLIGR